MIEDISGYDWDDGNYQKCQKHGVSIEEIETLFSSKVWIGPDINHSELEQRFLAIGKSTKGKYIFLAFTIREKKEEIFIRPISARYMHEKEVQKYEKNLAKNDN
ncbi:BrnT family toxin [Hassallia byssoidea VB512170]|uniref:BrnT family toxin n=1 Tax=Hassallia byssoidea VB512170 TaxID=1304833 RepID=A0A846H4A9_9CYAN|nr:BrnT family toxin [Hassalia byssoidea]NEU71429.1 BrnT family toxin [Hassalia byssoidea VB512170]